MNKKLFIIMLTITLVIIAFLYGYSKYTGQVEHFSNVKIMSSINEEILNYRQNTMPFTIKKENKDCEIQVNGKQYNKGERIYKPGKYHITAKIGSKKESSVVNINWIEKEEKNIYRIYVLPETLQALIGDLDISKNPDQKAFLWTARTSTINIEKIEKNMNYIKISQYNETLKPDEFREKIVPEIKEYVKNALRENSNAYFEMYMHEEQFYLELEVFGKLGLDDSRYDATMYTDGTKGYVIEHEMTKADSYDRYLKEKEDYFNIVEKIKNNTLIMNDYPGSYLVDKDSKVFNSSLNLDYMLISTLRNNIQLLLQFPEARKFEDEKVMKEMTKANLNKFSMQNKFNELTDEQKEIFFDIIGLDKKGIDEKYFKEENKEYIVITGTVPFYGLNSSKEKFENTIKRIVDDYGKDYYLLYKPHPRELPTEEQEEYLNSQNIKVLPGNIPMEAISFVYPNLKLGGFESSLYMNVDEGKTLFFFAKNKDELFTPLNELYDTLFNGAKFYY